MRESPASYREGTGRSYQPPPWLRMRATPLTPDEPCPTLFRYPGPCGLDRLFEGRLAFPGPPDSPELWACEKTSWTDVPGASHFGTLVLLRPLRNAPCRTQRPGVYLGVNLDLDPTTTAWIPPSRLASPIPWDEIVDAGPAAEALGNVSDERAEVAQSIRSYLDELTRLDQEGAARPPKPWCAVPEDERRELLARHGVPSLWRPRVSAVSP